MSQTSLTEEEDGYVPHRERAAYDEIRPLSVRMRDSVRAQLDVLAQLNSRSVTEETRLALEHWVERAKTDSSLKERADRVRADIDREADNRRKTIEREVAARRSAIAAVLGSEDAAEEAEADHAQESAEEAGEAEALTTDEKPAVEAAESNADEKAPAKPAKSATRRGGTSTN
jgi:hypothetical protein